MAMEFSRGIVQDTLVKTVMCRGLWKYLCIMGTVHHTNVAQNEYFQRVYNDFYVVRSRKKEWYKVYFTFMQNHKDNVSLTFEETLHHLYNKTGRIEASFSSKLLATVNPQMPIWDTHVLRNTRITAPKTAQNNSDKQLQESIDTYNLLIGWYKDHLKTKDGKFMVERFDKIYRDNRLTDVKKVDFILWQIRGDQRQCRGARHLFSASSCGFGPEE
ncbi:MAG: hypothetical protein LBP80_11500 [Treponema sp.]|nr:hypothetical protein [Treponema sp.]